MSTATTSGTAACSTVSYVRDLADPGAGLTEVGGKGASLARLAAAGLPVPPGFHVTTAAYRRFVTAAGIAAPVLAAAGAADPDRPETCDRAAAAIADLFAAHPLPDDVVTAVIGAYAALRGGAAEVAVRSSATAEDLPDLSFAGQQDSYLGIQGVEALHDAVRRCWASLWTSRAIAYRARNTIAADDVALAVVVQALVPADAAGVLFTADPVTGERGRTVVNAAWGLGEAVVGGAVTPDTLVVDGSGAVLDERVADKTVMTVREGAGTREVPVPEDRRRAPVLTAAEAAALAALGRRVEALYGAPTDVEWARAGGAFFLVQARPITTLSEPALWNDSRSGDHLWTSTNLGEAVPDVMTPATWSFVRVFLAESLPVQEVAGYPVCGRIGGRLYLDLSALVSLGAAFGILRRTEEGMRSAFGVRPAGVDIPLLPASRRRLVASTLGQVVRGRRRMRAARRELPAYLAGVQERCDALRGRIAAADDAGTLVALWRDELEPLLHQASLMLGVAARGDQVLAASSRLLGRTVSQEDANLLLSGAGADGAMLASLGPVVGLARLVRGETDRATYAARWGHRSPHEFEVSAPRPAEDPDWIDRQLAGGAGTGGDAVDLLARRDAARAAATERLRAANPRRAAKLRRVLDRWAHVARQREAARSEVVRVFWPLRAWTLRAGELTGLGDDVFMLASDEIVACLRGDREAVAAVPERRRAYERYAALPPYPNWIRGAFDPFAWAADPDRRTDVYDATARNTEAPAANGAASATVTGRPGASGVVEGVARVLGGADEGERLRAGEVLVANTTNVGWTPLFPRAAAVVTDVGAPLSHAAIVARELGIPAVVGCGDATTRIRTGDRVRVDGARGTVDVLP